MSLFKEKEKISKSEFSEALEKANPILPGTGRRLFSFKERIKMGEKLFGRKPNTLASKEKYRKFLREVGVEKYRATDISKKELVRKKIRILKKLGGV